MDIFILLIMVALLIEGIVETLKLIYDTTTRKVSIPITCRHGWAGHHYGLRSIICRPAASGVPPDWLGYARTGILISRGSSFVHDLWGKLTSYKENTPPNDT
jgi:hypothetical protein